MKKIIFILAIIVAFSSCQKINEFIDFKKHPDTPKADAAVALDWFRLETRFMLANNTVITAAYLGYLGIGLYEAVRNETKNSVSLSTKLFQMPQMPRIENASYDWVLSANAAMASLLKTINTGLTPANLASIDSLENAYNQQSTTPLGSDKFNRSQAFGRSIATAIYNWYLTDNYNGSNVGYIPPVFPGAWVPTPPAYANGINPFVGAARLFLASNASVVVPPPPYPYSETPGSDFYKMAKRVYDVNLSLTTEQKNIANFYVDQGNGIGYTPPGHDFNIVTQIILAKNVGLAVAAEVYAKAGIAERDAIITVFKAKYTYNQLRPVTYIRKLIDPTWLPFIPTPPHPEYPAAHAFDTGSVMEAVSTVLGDEIDLTDHSYDFRGWAPRSFTSIFGVAEEAGISRLYGGIHYLESINTGLAIARLVGGNVGDIKLQN